MVLRILNYVYVAILIAFVVGGAWLIANVWASYPIVSVSQTTGECVRVIGGDKQYGCDSMPDRYMHVWVK